MFSFFTGRNGLQATLLVCIGTLALPGVASANIGEAFGFGSRTAALAGAGVAWGSDAFASYTNPAALGLRTGTRLALSYAIADMEPHFKSIDNVVTNNDYTGEGSIKYENVDTSYRSSFGNALGIVYSPFPEVNNLSFGLVGYLPINQVAYMDTGEVFVPEYFLYRARTQRPQLDAGVGIETVPGLFIGAGFHVGFSLTTNATVFLQSNNQNQPSSMRFAASLKPKAAPYFGILYSSAPDAQPYAKSPEGSYTLGAVFRLPVDSVNTLILKAGAQALGNIATLDFNTTAMSSLFYDPMTLELGTSWQYASFGKLITQMDYQVWKNFKAPALVLQQPSVQEGGVIFSPSRNPTFPYRNIWIPRVAHELTVDNATLRVGYAYRPSIISGVPNGAGNYLDPSKHIVTAGLGFRFKKLLGYPKEHSLDFHFAWHQLLTQKITKTPGDESGESGSSKVGAPGYEAGGKLFGGGLSLSVAL